MPETTSKKARPQEAAEPPTGKQPYHSPTFTAFGSIAELTKGAHIGGADGAGGSTQIIP